MVSIAFITSMLLIIVKDAVSSNLGFWCSLDSRLSDVQCFVFASYGYSLFEIGSINDSSGFWNNFVWRSAASWALMCVFSNLQKFCTVHSSPSGFISSSFTNTLRGIFASLRELAFDYHLAQKNVNIASVFRSYHKAISMKLIWMLPLVDSSVLRSAQ